MASLVSSTQAAALISQLENLWDTFLESVTIVKEASVSDAGGGTFLPAYGPIIPDSVTNTTESQNFEAWFLEKTFDADFHDNIMKNVPVGTIMLKVKEDAKTYIENGVSNLHVIARDRKFNIEGIYRVANFLGQKYYYYTLKLVQ